jgi:uncharacterized protein
VSEVLGEPRLTSFLVKVASRCNLDCDYCYVYHHADQSWRDMPRLLNVECRSAFAARLKEYVHAVSLKRAVVVFHGGEPLLMGAPALAEFAAELREAVGPEVDLDVGMQTNGLLLTADVVRVLRDARISVSVSLDGPREANDLHRNSRRGRSSFDRVIAGLSALQQAPEILAGVICVVDPRVSPRTLLAFFEGLGVPKIDFLLPDAHHQRWPPGRDSDPDLYIRWLIEAFDCWFDEYPSIPVRTFEALLDSLAGLPSNTDAFGFGDLSLISIETDGTYHDLDVLKITRDGAARLEGSVLDMSIQNVARSAPLQAHRKLLRKDGLSPQCQTCEVVDICGGGAVPHRYGLNGFSNPTVYCREMKALIGHARKRLTGELRTETLKPAASSNLGLAAASTFELAEASADALVDLVDSALDEQEADLRTALSGIVSHGLLAATGAVKLLARSDLRGLARMPGAVAWSRATSALIEGRPIFAVDGTPLTLDPDYASRLASAFDAGTSDQVHLDDPWLRHPFGNAIYFEGAAHAAAAMPAYEEAMQIIRQWRPAVAAEMALTCSAVQFIRDPSADPDKIVSFSDNSVPGALYVSVYQGEALIDPYDLADSLVHEYRHQKLYLLERSMPLAEPGGEKVRSPWREELRPTSGLFHAVFVFVELKRFWEYVLEQGPARVRTRAAAQLHDTRSNLRQGFDTLKNCRLTPTGLQLAAALAGAAQLP